MSKEKIDSFRDTIISGDMELGLEQLLEFLKPMNSRYEQEVILHLSRVRSLSKDERMGVVSREQIDLTRARISYGVLEMLEELERMFS